MGIAARPGPASGASNQPPPLAGYNLFSENRPLVEALEREGAAWAVEQATSLGEQLDGEPAEWARLANENPPRLRTHDRFGNRIDEVEFHPAWHSLLAMSVGHGAHALSWREARDGAQVARAALFYLVAQVEAGHTCPLSMTHAAVPALRAQPELAEEWEPRLTSLAYDPGLRPAAEKRGALCGMAMTERQGGSDVRANITRGAGSRRRRVRAHGAQVVLLGPDVRRVSRPRAGGGRAVLLPAPARAPRRHAQRLPDRAAEGQARRPLQRLERDRARPRVGAARRRRGSRRADDHRDGQPHAARLRARHGGRYARRGRAGDAPRRLPLGLRHGCSPTSRSMRNVLADLCVESEAATVTALRLARAYDRGERARSRASRPRSRSTGSASAARATPPRRSSASAATATSRSRSCLASTASSRCSRSGRDRET